MKRKNVGLVLATLAIVAIGSGSLMLSATQIKGTVQEGMGEDVALGSEVADAVVETEEIVVKDDSYSTKLDAAIQSYWDVISDVKERKEALEQEYEERGVAYIKANFIYQGQNVKVKDALVTKDEAIANATKVMDYVYSYVDELLLKPYGIDKTEYTYSLQRQYHRGGIYYSVLFIQGDSAHCTLGIRLDEEPSIRCFTRDGLIDLCGREDTPEEYRVENWCNTSEERAAIYAQYLDSSKDIIENVLKLPAILEEVKNVDNISYFSVTDGWSMVTFGYVLEDGTYIKMIYNRVNQMWDGFVIDGYHEDYVD